MKGLEERNFLQKAQDLLADFAGIPLCLFRWDAVKKKIESGRFDLLDRESMAAQFWSYNATFFRLLEREAKLKTNLDSKFEESIKRTLDLASQGIFDPNIFKDDLDHYGFTVPVTRLEEAKDKPQRIPVFLLCSGPIHITEKPHTWEAFINELDDLREHSQQGKSFQLQLACEFMGLPTRPDIGALEEEARNLQYACNGIVRDLLPMRRDVGNLEAIIFELLRHIRNSKSYFSGLKAVKEALTNAQALGVVFKNPVSATGFLALYVPGEKEQILQEQMFFIPKPETVNKLLTVDRQEKVPWEEIGHYKLPEQARFLQGIDVPSSWNGDSANARLFIWFRDQRTAQHALRRHERSFIRPFLQGAGLSWATISGRVRARVSQAQHNLLTRKHNEFTDAIAAFSLPSRDERDHVTGANDLREILRIAQVLIGFDKAVYYRPHLYKKELRAEPVVWLEGKKPEGLPITPDIFNTLFEKLEPIKDKSSVLFPIASGDRCIGIMQFMFGDEGVPDEAMPLLEEFVNRLSLRIPYRRVIEILRELPKVLEREDLFGLAEKFAYFFSESACSIWRYDVRSNSFELIDRVGLELRDKRVQTKREAQGTVMYQCVSTGAPQRIPRDAPFLERSIKQALKEQGFKQGIGVASDKDDFQIVVVFWSKVDYSESYYSQDDLSIIKFVSFVLLQFLRLRSILKEREHLFNTIITGLGHELGAPITVIAENVKRIKAQRVLHLREDLVWIAEYAKTLIDGLSVFAELEKPFRPAKEEERRRYSLFEDIFYRVENTLRWRASGKGLKMEIKFDPHEFPPGVWLTQEEKDYLFSIMFNLLVNAIKYTPPGESRPIEVVGEVTRPGAVIKVRNYGIGVLEQDRDRIFEPLQRGENAFRASPTGSGLGLYIARMLAKRLKAEVELTKLRDPTEFALRLPAEILLPPWEEVKRDER